MKKTVLIITLFLSAIFLVGCNKTGNEPIIEKVEVTFEMNGGLPVVEKAEIELNSFVTEPIAPMKEDHEFIGWFSSLEDESPFNFTGTPITSNLTLHAKWRKVYEMPVGEKLKIVFENYDENKADLYVFEEVNGGGNIIEPGLDGTYVLDPGIYSYGLRNKAEPIYTEYNKVLLVNDEKIDESFNQNYPLIIDAFEGYRSNNGNETKGPIGMLNDESIVDSGARGVGNLTNYSLIDEYETPALNRLREGKNHQYTSNQEIDEFLKELKNGNYPYSKYMYVYVVGYTEKFNFPIHAVLFTKANVANLSYEEAFKVASDEAVLNEKVRVMHIATVHGNEHSPTDGELAIIYQLAKGTYTDGITSDLTSMEQLFDLASFVIIPQLNADGAYEDARYQQARQVDPNRDKLMIQLPENQIATKAYNYYLPDLLIDGHELFGDQIIYQSGFARVEIQIGPKSPNMVGEEIAMYHNSQLLPYVLQTLNNENIVASPYNSGTSVISGANFYSLTGSMNVLIEARGQGIGLDYYPRRVYSYVTSAKAITDKVINDARDFEYSEELMRRNYSTSKTVDSWFDLKTSDSVLNMVDRRRKALENNNALLVLETNASGLTVFGDVVDYYGNGNAGRFSYDGRIEGSTIRNLNFHDTYTQTRNLPDGYFVDKDTFLTSANNGNHHTTLKEIFDNHSIEYYYMNNLNDSLKLQQLRVLNFDNYPLDLASSHSYKTNIQVIAKVGEKQINTNFVNGAYFIPTNQLRGLLAAHLLEQDILDNMRNNDSLTNNNMGALHTSLYGAGYLKLDSDRGLPIYRYYEGDNSNVNLETSQSVVVRKENSNYLPITGLVPVNYNNNLELENLYLKTLSNNEVIYTQITNEMVIGLKKDVLGQQLILIEDDNKSATLNVFVKKDVVEDMSVIFVRDTGDDNLDGLSDINAVRTLRRAYELLLENNSGKDGTIVVVGPVLHSEVDDVLPHHDIVITITAIYNEANYQFNEGMLVLYQNMLLNGPTIFENINIKNGTTQTTRGIYAQGNDLVIGENVETIKSKLNYPSIMGGSPDGTLNKDVNIIIKSGYWRNFFGGSYRGVLNGNVTVKIYGGTFENMFYGGAYQLATSDKVLTSVYVSGDVEIEIFDGYFICGVYAGSNYGDIIGNTKITINGGIFEKGISPSSNRGIVSGNQSIIDNR